LQQTNRGDHGVTGIFIRGLPIQSFENLRLDELILRQPSPGSLDEVFMHPL
jgi:hypothetical protein